MSTKKSTLELQKEKVRSKPGKVRQSWKGGRERPDKARDKKSQSMSPQNVGYYMG